ncbi:MAG: hypothetical protein KAT53_07040, partial [Dehalococcoidia bacterium]|nr:hypothetical protein [Dehalococcoidia bacterium]
GYSGSVYVNSDTAADDTARRFATAEKKLRDVIVKVEDNDQLFGTASAQTFPVAAGEWMGFTKVDVSALYFKNKTAGLNGTVHIIGVED